MNDRRAGPFGPAGAIRSNYIRVVVVWVLVLIALYAFQEYFT